MHFLNLLNTTDGWMGGWVDGWTDGWMGGWVDGWMGGLMDGWVDGRSIRIRVVYCMTS